MQAAFRTIIIKGEYDAVKHRDCPRELMRELNQRIIDKYEHLEMCFPGCLFDITRPPGAASAAVRYVNGGFPSSVHVADGAVHAVCGYGSLLGTRRDPCFEVKEFTIDQGDALFVFTDGLYEPRNRNGREYGYRRLSTALQSWRTQGLRRAAENAFTQLESYIAPRPLTDDATLICLEMTGW